MRAELLQLFRGENGRSLLIDFLIDFDDWPRPQLLLDWLFELFSELPEGLWCDVDMLVFLLKADFTQDGFPALRLLRRAMAQVPALAEDEGLLITALNTSFWTACLFSASLLELPGMQDLVIDAVQRQRAAGDKSSLPWPPDDFPDDFGFLASLPPAYATNRDFLLLAACYVDDRGESFRRLPEALRCDREVALQFAKFQGGVLRHVGAALQGDAELVLAALLAAPDDVEGLWRQLPPRLWGNRDVLFLMLAQESMQKNFFALHLLDMAMTETPALAADVTIFLAALNASFCAACLFSASLLELPGVQQLLIDAVQRQMAAQSGGDDDDAQGRRALPWPRDHFPEGFLAALPASYSHRRFLLLAACHVDDRGASFRRLPEALRFDREVALSYARAQPGVLPHVGAALQADREVVQAAAQAAPDDLVCSPLWADDELVCLALERWGVQLLDTRAGSAIRESRPLLLCAAELDCAVLSKLAREQSIREEQQRALLRGEKVWHHNHLWDGFATSANREVGLDWGLVQASFTGPHARALLEGRPADSSRLQALLRCTGSGAALLRELWRRCVAASLRDDRGFVRGLLALHGGLLGVVDARYAVDEELVRVAVRQDGSALVHAGAELWSPEAPASSHDEPAAKRRRTAEEPLSLAKLLLGDNSDCWPLLPAGLRAQLRPLDRFECCVCAGLPTQGIRMCPEGNHFVCSGCAARVLLHDAKCPVCRKDVSNGDKRAFGARNRFAEEALREALRELR